MDDEIMSKLDRTHDQVIHNEIVVYFNMLSNIDGGWKPCVAALLSGNYNDTLRQYFLLQVIEGQIKNFYNSTPGLREGLREFLLAWPSVHKEPQPTLVSNKVAQVAAMVFIRDFPEHWPTFFHDFIQMISLGSNMIDFYLRTLLQIDLEITDREITRSSAEILRNNIIKDAMRETSTVQLAETWYQILTNFQQCAGCTNIFGLCHQVIGSYILWIDINLIANDRFVTLLVRDMNEPAYRETAVDCVCDIINKGMEPLSKVKLVESFSSFLSSVGIWQVLDVSGTDEEYLAKLGKLLNGMGVNLIDSYNKIYKAAGSKSTESSLAIIDAMESKFSLLIKFLSHEDDDVSASVLDFLRDYLHLLKSKTVLIEKEMYHVTDIVQVLCMKIRYDREYDFDREGEEEACFKEFRKQLKIVLDNVISVDKPLVIDQLRDTITDVFQNWKQLPFQDVEAALFLLHVLGESVPPGLLHFVDDPEKYSTVQKLLLLMSNSEVCQNTHPAVAIQYFEVVVRYEKFFLHHWECTPPVLTTFLRNSGLNHPDRKVRSRSVYLLSRFIKTIRTQITSNLAQEILKAVGPLLPIVDPSVVKYENRILSDDDQLYLYEIIGVVILSGETQQAKRYQYMKQVVQPLLEIYQNFLKELAPACEPLRKEYVVGMMQQVISLTGRLSKAFSSQDTMKNSGCATMFLDSLLIFMMVVNVTNGEHRRNLQSNIRQYLHRMVVCLDSEILPVIPAVTEVLLRGGESKNLQEYIPLLNQIITKFKKDVVPYLRQIIPQLISSVYQEQQIRIEPEDENGLRERRYLQRQYYMFIQTIISNIAEVLPEDNMQIFQHLMESAILGATSTDLTSQKICVSILKKFVEIWAGPEASAPIVEFIYQSIIPACFTGPSLPIFDTSDAQCVIVLNETAHCLQAILEKRGDEFLSFLRTQFFPKTNVQPHAVEAFIVALRGPVKSFKAFLKVMFTEVKAPT